MRSIKSQLHIPNHLANDTRVSGVFYEINENLLNLITSNQIQPKPLLICSGGTSSRCASDGHWTLDLRKKYTQIKIDQSNHEVEVDAGVKMGKLIKELSLYGSSFPIGLSGETGIGYILSGGISPISRNQGLAIDQIKTIKGFWGTGEKFKISEPNELSTIEEVKTWRALNGAAAFLGIITSVTLKIQRLNRLYICQAILSPEQLAESIYQAEYWPKAASLQWLWGSQIKAYVIIELDKNMNKSRAKQLLEELPFPKPLKTSIVSGIKELPIFSLQNQKEDRISRIHSEVLGLLGEEWGDSSKELIKSIANLIEERPHKSCYLAAQQLGGFTKERIPSDSSFIHRTSIWKPWINGAWDAGDSTNRIKSLLWMEKLWKEIEPLCPGVHLAQMHQHLPWHQKEIRSAFKDWLPELQKLKSRYDPEGILPPL